MTKKFRQALAVAFILVTLLTVSAILTVNHFLNSDQLYLKAQNLLKEKFSTSISYSKAEIDILSKILITNLEIHTQLPELQINILIKKLSLNYGLNIFTKAIHLAELSIEDSDVSIHSIHLHKEPPDVATQGSSSAQKILRELLQSPPAKVLIHLLNIKNLNLLFENESFHQKSRFQLADFNAQARLQLEPRQITAAVQIKLLKPSRLTIRTTPPSGIEQKPIEIDTEIQNLDIDLDGKMILNKDQLLVNIAKQNLEFRLNTLKYETPSDQQYLRRQSLLTDVFLSSQIKTDIQWENSSSLNLLQFDMTQNLNLAKTQIFMMGADRKNAISKNSANNKRLEILGQKYQGRTTKKGDLFQTDLQWSTKSFSMSKWTQKPLPATITMALKFDSHLSHIKSDIKAQVNQLQILDSVATWLAHDRDSKSVFKYDLEGQIDYTNQPALFKSITPLKALSKFNAFKSQLQFNIAQKSESKVQFNGRLSLPHIEMPQLPQTSSAQLEVSGILDHFSDLNPLSFNIEINNPSYGHWKTSSENIFLKQGPDKLSSIDGHLQIQLLDLPKAINIPFPVPQAIQLKYQAKSASLENAKQVQAHLNLMFGSEQLDLTAQIKNNLQTKDYEIQSQLGLTATPHFPILNGIKLQGFVQAPLHVLYSSRGDIDLRGDLEFKNFVFEKPNFSIQQINGRIPISEQLKVQDHKLVFSQILRQNPFERVDFIRIRPLMQAANQIFFPRLRWHEKTLGPFTGSIAIEQNRINISQFDMALDKGAASGEIFIDAYPSQRQFGILARITDLDVNTLFPKKYLTNVGTGSKLISGRTGVVLDINKQTLNGRLDITQIGGPQIVAAINIIDPEYADSKLNKIRKFLELGYPNNLDLSFAEGIMALDLDLSILGVHHKEAVRGISLHKFISGNTQKTATP